MPSDRAVGPVVSNWREAGVSKVDSKTGHRPLRPELPATATMSATEHARDASNPSGWRVAVVVLRYFVAVRQPQPPRS